MVDCSFLLKNLIKKFQENKGMSIAQTLIVVAILVVLMVLAIAAFKPWTQQAKARDAQRKSDLRKLKNPLEDYYNDHDCYPEFLDDLVPDYIGIVPLDPLTGEQYEYHPDLTSCNLYRVYTKMEFENDPDVIDAGCEWGCGPVNEDDESQVCSYNYGVCSSNTVLESCEGCPTWMGCGAGFCNTVNPLTFRGIKYCNDPCCGDQCIGACNAGCALEPPDCPE